MPRNNGYPQFLKLPVGVLPSWHCHSSAGNRSCCTLYIWSECHRWQGSELISLKLKIHTGCTFWHNSNSPGWKIVKCNSPDYNSLQWNLCAGKEASMIWICLFMSLHLSESWRLWMPWAKIPWKVASCQQKGGLYFLQYSLSCRLGEENGLRS